MNGVLDPDAFSSIPIARVSLCVTGEMGTLVCNESEAVMLVTNKNEIAVLRRPCTCPFTCALSTSQPYVALVHQYAEGCVLTVSTWDSSSRLEDIIEIRLPTPPASKTSLVFSQDGRFLACVLQEDALLCLLDNGLHIFITDAIKLSKSLLPLTAGTLLDEPQENGRCSLLLGGGNQTVYLLPFSTSLKDSSGFVIGEPKPLIYSDFVVHTMRVRPPYLIILNDLSLTVIQYAIKFVKNPDRRLIELHAHPYFEARNIRLDRLGPGIKQIYNSGLCTLSGRSHDADACFLLLDTDVGVTCTPLAAISELTSFLLHRDPEEPNGLEQSFGCLGILSYSIVLSAFGRNTHVFVISTPEKKHYLLRSSIRIGTVPNTSLDSLLTAGFAPTPRSYRLVFADRDAEAVETTETQTWVLPRSSPLNPAHPRLQNKLPKDPSLASKKPQVRSSGYTTAPWSEQQKQKKGSGIGKPQSRPPSDRQASGYISTAVGKGVPVLSCQTSDDNTVFCLTGEGCISMLGILKGRGAIKAKGTIILPGRADCFSTHVSGRLVATPGSAGTVTLQTVEECGKERLVLAPRRKGVQGTTWCSFIWPQDDSLGLCLGATGTVLTTFHYNISKGEMSSTELGTCEYARPILTGGCFTKFKSTAVVLAHTPVLGDGEDVVLTVSDLGRMSIVSSLLASEIPHVGAPSVFVPDGGYETSTMLYPNIMATSGRAQHTGEVALYDIRRSLRQPFLLFQGVSVSTLSPRVAFVPRSDRLVISNDLGRMLLVDLRHPAVELDSAEIYKPRNAFTSVCALDGSAIVGGAADGTVYAFTSV
ncbi:hypothetical protein GMRT_14549 [Giardia muris]|uniref:WD40 repeat protein n=1 Tax=Giardia muris TaxID=5742 RepID=A0A4Z1ST00_GIAMU|nr:hypothetical protein GMRT_14549 [Giardia muris]|eukprot:TNJ29056.1 hypothetical protein GMRT_14549 [Giardia muris]